MPPVSNIESKILDYDSQLFGFPVARIKEIPEDEDSLRASLTLLRKQGVGLVYGYTAGGEQVESAAARSGGLLVDRRVIFIGDTSSVPDSEPPNLPEIVPFDGPVTPALESLSLACGAHSRFFTDPRVPRSVFATLYRTWLVKSLTGELAERVFVVRNEGVECGFVTVTGPDERPAHGLMAVDQRMRGQGIGRALFHTGLRHHLSLGRRFVYLPTQQSNPEACGLYSKVCSIEQIQLVYHFWLS